MTLLLRIVTYLIFICILLVTVACTNRISVVVNAIATDSASITGKRYVLSSAMDDVDKRDLFFQEFSHYFDHILQKQGFSRAESKKTADIEILFGYGISNGKTDISTFSWPVYEAIAGESITITENSTGSSGKPTTTTRTIYIPPRFARVGTSIESKSYTTFNRTAILEARKMTVDGGSGDTLWKILISSVGTSNDIREIMPFLAVASANFIGKNSSEKRELVIKRDNPLLLELKSTVKK